MGGVCGCLVTIYLGDEELRESSVFPGEVCV